MTEAKFCKDCCHCQILTGAVDKLDYSKCIHPATATKPVISLVTGELEPIQYPYASTERISGKCGLGAILFMPIIPDLPTGAMGGMYHGRTTGVGV